MTMYSSGKMEPIELACPIPIDRSAEPRRHGWSRDPGSRYVACEWAVYFVDGDIQQYPNGPMIHRGASAAAALLEHIRSDWHTVEDFIALARRPA